MNMEEASYIAANPRSRWEFDRARKHMPAVAKGAYYYRPFPLTMKSGQGCLLMDVDDHTYVDFAGHHTVQILGHNHPAIMNAVGNQLRHGTATAAPMGVEADLAEELCTRVESVDRVRFCNSGTEASLHALRLARAFTGRTKIAKFEGGYHGSNDAVEISVASVVGQSGPPQAPVPVPSARGLAPSSLEDILILPYDDETAVEALIDRHGSELAAVLLDPRCGILVMRPEFVRSVRKITADRGILLIFDEIVGFRAGSGGLQTRYGIKADITLFGKIIGGGFPVGAFGGRDDIMALLDPTADGSVFQSGTFSGHPVTMAAGLAMLKTLTADVFRHLDNLTEQLKVGLMGVFESSETPARIVTEGSVFSVYFQTAEPRTARDILSHDSAKEHELFLGLVNRGYYLGNGTRMCSLSLPMTTLEVTGLIEAVDSCLN